MNYLNQRKYFLKFSIPKHACPEAKGSNSTTGCNFLWACDPFGGNSNNWQVSREEAGQIISKSIAVLMYQNVTNKSLVTAYTLTTGRWVFFMGFLPQDIIFLSVHIVWHTALLNPLDEWLRWNVIPNTAQVELHLVLYVCWVLGGSS